MVLESKLALASYYYYHFLLSSFVHLTEQACDSQWDFYFTLCLVFMQDESKLYIFIELVTKGSLRSLYQRYTLRDSQVSAYTRQILHGLKYLHDQNVVHRWLKILLFILIYFCFPYCIYFFDNSLLHIWWLLFVLFLILHHIQ